MEVRPAALNPVNARVNARLAHDQALRSRVTIEPDGSRQTPEASNALPGAPAATDRASPQSKIQNPKSKIAPVTSADVLEAIHRATGMPIVADFCARLYPVEAVSPRDQSLFAALNQVADAMGLRWHKEADGWLQFRSTRFPHDRRHEVPNRLMIDAPAG
jgi:hypothetical protein